MKRLISLLLIAVLLSGCTFSGNQVKEPVTFYYLRVQSDNASYDDYYAKGIIGSEEREASGYRDNISRLLAFYFSGPLDPELTSPFPAGCKVLAVHQDEGQLTVSVNPILAAQSELDITVACACLAMTCFDLADVDTVLIESKNLEDKILFSRTFTVDNFFLNDNYTLPAESAETIS